MDNRALVAGILFTASFLPACGGGCPMREASAPEEPAAPATETTVTASESVAPATAKEAEPTPESAPSEKIETVDCKRIDDPAYRKQVEASGIDPDSIDCNENDTGG